MLALYIIFIIVSYFIGALPFMALVGRLKGLDLTKERDLHDYLFNRMGKGWGIAGVLADMLKGVVIVLAGFLLQFPAAIVALGALAGICGQMWPVFNRFDGERGNSIGAGVNVTFSFAYGAPLAAIIAVCFVLIGLLIRTLNRLREKGGDVRERIKLGGRPSNVFPLSVILGFASFIPTSIFFNMDVTITWGFAGVLVLLLLRRLTGGLLADLKKSKLSSARIITNRLLYDRSEA